jgi:hypothetical protein
MLFFDLCFCGEDKFNDEINIDFYFYLIFRAKIKVIKMKEILKGILKDEAFYLALKKKDKVCSKTVTETILEETLLKN